MFEHGAPNRRQVVQGMALAGMGVALPASAQEATPIAALRAMFESYQKAFAAHDLGGLLKLFAPNAIILGTGPGEIWAGNSEIQDAYKRFFELFDIGKHTAEILFSDGGISVDAAWLITMSKMSFTKGTGTTEFGLNQMAVFEKNGGAWRIRAMHFSNLTPTPPTAPPRGGAHG